MSRAAFAPRCTVATRVPCGASRRRWTNTASAAWEFTLLLRSTISEKADAASEFLNFATWTAGSVAPQHQGGEHGSLHYQIWIADERSSGEERNAQDQCPKTPRQAHAHKVPEEVSRLPHERARPGAFGSRGHDVHLLFLKGQKGRTTPASLLCNKSTIRPLLFMVNIDRCTCCDPFLTEVSNMQGPLRSAVVFVCTGSTARTSLQPAIRLLLGPCQQSSLCPATHLRPGPDSSQITLGRGCGGHVSFQYSLDVCKRPI